MVARGQGPRRSPPAVSPDPGRQAGRAASCRAFRPRTGLPTQRTPGLERFSPRSDALLPLAAPHLLPSGSGLRS